MKHISNSLLFALVFSLAAADWLSVSTTAQDGASARREPVSVPAAALLTGATLRRATIDGLDVELEGTPGDRFILALHNPSARPRVAHFEVDCVQRTGSPISRMAPLPMVVHTQRVEVTVPARGTARIRLEADVSPPAPSQGTDAVPMGLGSFTSTSFRLRRAGAGPDAAPLAVLRWPAALAAAAS